MFNPSNHLKINPKKRYDCNSGFAYASGNYSIQSKYPSVHHDKQGRSQKLIRLSQFQKNYNFSREQCLYFIRLKLLSCLRLHGILWVQVNPCAWSQNPLDWEYPEC